MYVYQTLNLKQWTIYTNSLIMKELQETCKREPIIYLEENKVNTRSES